MMMEEGPIKPQATITIIITEIVAGSFEPEESNNVVVALEAGHEAIARRCLETSNHEEVEVDSDDKEVPQVANEGQRNIEVFELSESAIENVQEMGEAHPPPLLHNHPSPSFSSLHNFLLPLQFKLNFTSPPYSVPSKEINHALDSDGEVYLHPISFETYPLFQDLDPLSNELESFYNNVFANKGDIFVKCSTTWLVQNALTLSHLRLCHEAKEAY